MEDSALRRRSLVRGRLQPWREAQEKTLYTSCVIPPVFGAFASLPSKDSRLWQFKDLVEDNVVLHGLGKKNPKTDDLEGSKVLIPKTTSIGT